MGHRTSQVSTSRERSREDVTGDFTIFAASSSGLGVCISSGQLVTSQRWSYSSNALKKEDEGRRKMYIIETYRDKQCITKPCLALRDFYEKCFSPFQHSRAARVTQRQPTFGKWCSWSFRFTDRRRVAMRRKLHRRMCRHVTAASLQCKHM